MEGRNCWALQVRGTNTARARRWRSTGTRVVRGDELVQGVGACPRGTGGNCTGREDAAGSRHPRGGVPCTEDRYEALPPAGGCRRTDCRTGLPSPDGIQGGEETGFT